ncbi:MAG: hydroxymethylbilane synthase [Candidatus Hydrothermarchaeaceae archaeon]
MKLIIGTRGSKLALTQVGIISGLLKDEFPDLEFETRIIKTTGDKITDAPLAKIGGKGLFVKEIDEAVVRGDVDFAVHSMKDVPTEILPELEIVATPEREDVNDALISRDGLLLEELPKGAVIGTSSIRRGAQLSAYRPDLEVKDVRGNVDTRIAKVERGDYDAIIMAKAGLKRLGFEKRITQVLPTEIFRPSVGQGAIALIARRDFSGLGNLRAINHRESMLRVLAERALLEVLGGGCQVPIGVTTKIDTTLQISAAVISPDGKKKIEVTNKGEPKNAGEIGRSAGETLLKNGADIIINFKR